MGKMPSPFIWRRFEHEAAFSYGSHFSMLHKVYAPWTTRHDFLNISRMTLSATKSNVYKKSGRVSAEVVTVVLVDDSTIVRKGLRMLLELDEDIRVVGEAENGKQALRVVRELMPQVVVMDIMMPVMNGLEATRQILKELPNTRVILLSAQNDKAYIEESLRLKVAGYLRKQSSLTALSKLIRRK